MRLFSSPILIIAFSILYSSQTLATPDVMLDDFNSGSHNMTTTPFNGASSAQYDTQQATSGAAGPLRLIDHSVGSDANGSLTTQLTGDDLSVTVATSDNAAFVHGIFEGINGIPPAGPGNVDSNNLVPLNPLLDLSGETTLELEYTYTGPDFLSVVQIYAFTDPLSQTVFDQSTILFLEPGTNTLTLDIATFFNNVNPSQIGAIGFSFVTFTNCNVQFHRFEAVGGVSNQFVPPASYSVFRGVEINGSLADFVDSDDTKASYNPGFVLNSTEAPVWLVFDANAPTANAFLAESSALTPGLTYTVEAWNWSAGDFEEIGIEDESFNVDSVVEFPLSSIYIDTTGNVRSRVGWRKTGFTINFPWTVQIDQVGWSN